MTNEQFKSGTIFGFQEVLTLTVVAPLSLT